MYEKSLDEAERILTADKDIIVPVRKVWCQVVQQGESQKFEVSSLPNFITMLEADNRFELFPAHKSIVEDLENPILSLDPEEQSEMEKLGFCAGDLVKLRRVDLTPEMVGEILQSKIDTTMDALTRIWDLRPEGDSNAEGALLEMIEKAKVLQDEVKSAFSHKERGNQSKKIFSKKTPPPRKKQSTKTKGMTKKVSVKSSSKKKRANRSSPRRGKR